MLILPSGLKEFGEIKSSHVRELHFDSTGPLLRPFSTVLCFLCSSVSVPRSSERTVFLEDPKTGSLSLTALGVPGIY